MLTLSPRRRLLLLSLFAAPVAAGHAQTAAPAAAGATAAWTIKTKGDVRWQQGTPAGAPLISPPAGLAPGAHQPGPGTRGKTPPGGGPPRRRRLGRGRP